MGINTKKGRDYLLDRFKKNKSKILSCGVYRTDNGSKLVKVTMKNGKIYDFPGTEYAVRQFYRSFRKDILKIYI